MAGLTLEQVDDVAEIWNRVKAGDDTAATVVRWALANIPFANLFWARTGLDHLFLYQIQESLNPGFLRRFERRAKEENAQTFLLSPAAAMALQEAAALGEAARNRPPSSPDRTPADASKPPANAPRNIIIITRRNAIAQSPPEGRWLCRHMRSPWPGRVRGLAVPACHGTLRRLDDCG